MYNVLAALRAGTALTDKEKKIHDAGLVTLLKQIHDDLDDAVLEAYGWGDLAEARPLAGRLAAGDEAAEALEQELLVRLVALNHARAEEEGRGIVRWLRPEYLAPDAAAAPDATQGEIGLEPGKPAPGSTPAAAKLPWPAALPAQVAALQKLLPALGADPAALAAAFGARTKARLAAITDILETLRSLGNCRPGSAARRAAFGARKFLFRLWKPSRSGRRQSLCRSAPQPCTPFPPWRRRQTRGTAGRPTFGVRKFLFRLWKPSRSGRRQFLCRSALQRRSPLTRWLRRQTFGSAPRPVRLASPARRKGHFRAPMATPDARRFHRSSSPTGVEPDGRWKLDNVCPPQTLSNWRPPTARRWTRTRRGKFMVFRGQIVKRVYTRKRRGKCDFILARHPRIRKSRRQSPDFEKNSANPRNSLVKFFTSS